MILVYHCCGRFGFQIPWSIWMCSGIYPTCDTDRPFVYIYSLNGQPNHEMVGKVSPDHFSRRSPTRSICVDHYMAAPEIVDWDKVKALVMDWGVEVDRR